MDKICKTCELKKPYNEYNVRKDSKDGYRNECKVCLSNKGKFYYGNNKEIKNKNNKIWQSENKDKIIKNRINFNIKNPNYYENYNLLNRDKINERNKNRRIFDIKFKIKENIRTLISNSLRYSGFKKNQKSIEILGCSHDKFREHLENQFEDWMSWENQGNPKDGILEPNKSWDIDHIIPLNTGKTEEELIKLNHYTNLQPLCSYYNRNIKRGKNVL